MSFGVGTCTIAFLIYRPMRLKQSFTRKWTKASFGVSYAPTHHHRFYKVLRPSVCSTLRRRILVASGCAISCYDSLTESKRHDVGLLLSHHPTHRLGLLYHKGFSLRSRRSRISLATRWEIFRRPGGEKRL